MSTFRYAGVSRRDGVMKPRFANDQMRVKVLAKTGSSDIDIIELKEPMTKEDAIAFLLSIDFDNGNAEVRACLEENLGQRTKVKEPKAVKAPKAKAVKAKAVKSKAVKAPKAEITLDSIKAKAPAKQPKSTVSRAEIVAQLDDMEEAPF
jgi:hypothetical protein